MIVISVDPSMCNTALAAFDYDLSTKKAVAIDSTTIRTEKDTKKQVRASSDLIERCRVVHEQAHAFINKHSPVLIFVETPSGSQSSSGMKSYGVSCFLIATMSPKPIEVTPHEVKMASVGKKTASKAEMIEWAFRKHPELNWKMRGGLPQGTEEHLADGTAVLYAGMKTAEFSRAISMMASLKG